MSWWGSFYLQDILNSSGSMNLDQFHMLVLMIQIGIASLVGLTLASYLANTNFYQSSSEWMVLEVTWTILPAGILLYLGVPSLELLYKYESLYLSPQVVVKVMGNQWYWDYALPEFNVAFDSFTEKGGLFHLAEVSDQLVLPFMSNILMLVSSHDVIHSFALPSLGLKADANPGRLNSISFFTNVPGLHIGQCSELCGAMHSQMTINVELTSANLFTSWLSKYNS